MLGLIGWNGPFSTFSSSISYACDVTDDLTELGWFYIAENYDFVLPMSRATYRRFFELSEESSPGLIIESF